MDERAKHIRDRENNNSLNLVQRQACFALHPRAGSRPVALEGTRPPTGRLSRCTGLNLRGAAVHEQIGSGDVTAVIGGEEHHSLRDLVRRADPSELVGQAVPDFGDHVAR